MESAHRAGDISVVGWDGVADLGQTLMKMELNADNLPDAQHELEKFVATFVDELSEAVMGLGEGTLVSFELGEWSEDGLSNTLRVVIQKKVDE